jgi:hypothetical protein
LTVGGYPADQDEGDQAYTKAGRHQRKRYGVVVEFEDLKGQHHCEHAVGEDRQGDRRDQQAVLTDPKRCEHAPTAGVDHRLFNVELRTHAFDGL